jgi:hypothetical protein
MKSHVPTLALAPLAGLMALGALLVGLTGCGEDDFDRQAAFPEPVGYTPPPSQPKQAQVGQSAAPTSPPPPPPAQIPAPPSAPADDEVADGQQPVQPAPGEDYADTDPSALTDFRGALDPYGSWVDDPTYGTIWVPSSSVVGDDFTPYQTAGHWTYDDDYTWVSDYDWGWAPFHYGRWAYAAPYGWGWIPGRVYAGAWVNWRYGYGDWGYVGWAPMGPTWGWRGGMAVGLGFVPAEPYGFCATGNLFDQHINQRMVPTSQAGAVGAHTRPYVAANPTVNGTNGHVAAHPTVNGPSPQALGIPASAVAHGALANRGVVQARAYAHAGTAATLGGHEPQSFGSRGASPSAGGLAYGRGEPSHFGGKLGSGFSGSPYNMPHAYGSSYGSSYGHYGGSGYSGSSYRGGAYGLYGGYGSHAGPSFRGGYGGYGGSPMFGQPGVPAKGSGKSSRSTSTSSSWGGYSGGGHGGGGYHGGGGHGGGHR